MYIKNGFHGDGQVKLGPVQMALVTFVLSGVDVWAMGDCSHNVIPHNTHIFKLFSNVTSVVWQKMSKDKV